MTLRINTLTARRGVHWVGAGFALFLKHALGFSLLFLLGLVPMLLLGSVPVIGAMLMFVVGPPLALGFAIAARAAAQGSPVRATHLFEPFRVGADRARRNTLIRLSLLYALCTAAMLLLVSVLGGEAFDQLMTIARGGEADTMAKMQALLIAHPELQFIGLMPALLLGLLSAVFWHAPMLVWWQGQGVAKSLFSSTLACWRNKGAFTLYSLAWAGIGTLYLIVSTLAFALIGMPQLAVLAWQPGLLLFLIAFYVSVYFSYADCFTSDEAV